MTRNIWLRALCSALFITTITLFQSCQKDEIDPAKDKTLDYEHAENRWIFDQIKHWYLWTDSIPENFSKTYYTKNADEYFESLLYKRNDTYGDRFSYIEKKNSSQSKASLPVKTGFGFEFKYLRSTLHAGNSNPQKILLYVVYYVHPDSPAEKAGLKRGDLIYKINGEYINDTDGLNGKTTVNVKLASLENFYLVFRENDPTRDITIGQYTDSPIWSNLVLSNGSKKVGYLCYRMFEEGSDQYLIETFKRYKQEGVSDVILDLRYNPGGRLSVAQTLGGLIIPTDKLGQNYIIQEPNQTLKNSSEVNLTLKTPKTQAIIDANLGLERLYVLTGTGTASASETTILCTKPYVKNVYVIGSTTKGKNQSSVELTNAKYDWALNPIIARLYNCNNETFKVTGIIPDYEINEDQTFPYKELGDPNEPLLNAALYHISNGEFPEGTKSSREHTLGEFTIANLGEGGNRLTLDDLK